MRIFRLPIGRKNVSEDVDAELAFHLESRTEELIGQGQSPAAALAQARAEFGSLSGAHRDLTEVGHRREGRLARLEWWSEAWQDARIALRSYRRDPLFTTVVLLTL